MYFLKENKFSKFIYINIYDIQRIWVGKDSICKYIIIDIYLINLQECSMYDN